MSKSHLTVAILSFLAYTSLPASIALSYTQQPVFFTLFVCTYFVSSVALLMIVAKECKQKKWLLLYALPILGLLTWVGYKSWLFGFGETPD